MINPRMNLNENFDIDNIINKTSNNENNEYSENSEDSDDSDDEDNTENTLKVILLGDTNTGKTSFVNKLIGQESELTTTIGIDFIKYSVKYKQNIIKSILWDTAGMERFGSIVSSYYRMIDGAIIFIDLNNIDSYQSFEYWLNDVIYYVKIGIIYIIGNKNDLERKISKDDIINYININYKNYEIYYKEISIKNNVPNVKDIYSEYIINLHRKINNKKTIINNTTIKMTKNKNKKCCF